MIVQARERPGGLAFAEVSELREWLDRGELTSIELTDYVLDRLTRYGDEYNAVACLSPDRARASAATADRRRASGERGPLLGIPYGAKDIFLARGTETHAGSNATFSYPSGVDATVVRRLERAGAPLAAKLALVELVGFGTQRPTSSAQGPARTPWDLGRWAGGSSGGSGAAVAAGLVPFALGSESAGSIGSPSAWCGVTGFRPSLGLVGRGGMTPLSPTLDKAGVLSRSAADARSVMNVIAGGDASDPVSHSSSRGRRPSLDLDAGDLSSLRVAYAESDMDAAAPLGVRNALRGVIETMRDLGVRLVDRAIPASFPYRSTLETIMNYEAVASFRELIDTGQVDLLIDPAAREAVRAPGPTRAEYEIAQRARRALVRAFGGIWAASDLILTTNFVTPWPIPSIEGRFGDAEIRGGNTAMVWAGNIAGLPAAFLPVGISDEGLPVSIKIVGPRWSDQLVLAFGVAFQRITSWHRLVAPFAHDA